MKIEINIVNDPKIDPKKLSLSMPKKLYSKPKLYIPKDENGKPSVAKGARWRVWFNYRNPENGRLDIKCTFTKGLNRYDTVQERKKVGAALCRTLEIALERGWVPVKKLRGQSQGKKVSKKALNITEALDYALKVKTFSAEASTLTTYQNYLNPFKAWLVDNNKHHMPVQKFTIDHFFEYYDYLRFQYKKKDGEPLSATSINNHKRNISALFSTMQNERLVKENVISGIPNIGSKPLKNEPFTHEQLKKLRVALADQDPYLLVFFKFIIYGLFRESEICRLTVGDFDLKNWTVSVKTKTDQKSTRRIIDKLKEDVNALELEKYPENYHVFTKFDKPAVYETKKLKSKVDHFGRRFKKVLESIPIKGKYGLYSGRHTAIVNLYNSFVASGMNEHQAHVELMPLTQHKSIESLKKYLRKVQLALPPDHSEVYTLDF